MNKQRDSRGRFVSGHRSLFEGGVERILKPATSDYPDYTKKLLKMLKRQKRRDGKK